MLAAYAALALPTFATPWLSLLPEPAAPLRTESVRILDAPETAPSASLEAWLDEAWRRVARERIVRLSASHGLAEAHWHRYEALLAPGSEPAPVEFFDVAVAVARELLRLGVEP